MRKKKNKILRITGLVLLILFVFVLFYKPDNQELQSFSLQEWLRFPAKVKADDMKYRIKVAATSLHTNPNKDSCLRQIIDMVTAIKQKEPDTRLVVLGEASLGTYFNTQDPEAYQKTVAETIPGSSTDILGKLANKLHLFIAAGLIEKAENKLFNSMVVIDTGGHIIAKHQKLYLHPYDRANGISEAKNNAEIFVLDGFKIGLSICADANKKWLIKEYSQKGTIDILLYPVTSSVPWIVNRTGYWPMATSYHSWIVASNRVGQEGRDNYSGFIFVSDNTGAVQKMQNGKTGYITAVIGKN